MQRPPIVSAAPPPDIVSAVAGMVHDAALQSRLRMLDLVATDVSWDDTARDEFSCSGRNISDVSLVAYGRPFPIVRFSNYRDSTTDLAIESLTVVVGNEAGEPLRRIPLTEYLDQIGTYARNARLASMIVPSRDLSAKGGRVLASAQACVLPLRDGKVSFHVGCRNYQSTEQRPAVLVIVATNEGTSAQVLRAGTNALYFNRHGRAFEWESSRLEDDRRERGVDTAGPRTADEKDRNVIAIIQVPLHVPEDRVREGYHLYTASTTSMKGSKGRGVSAPTGPTGPTGNPGPRGFDHAVVQAGSVDQGPYPGTRDLVFTRDAAAPIRVTYQLYEVTDSAHVPDAVVDEFALNFATIYSHGTATGSLPCQPREKRPTQPGPVSTPAPPPTGTFVGNMF